jgi:hypothetical protein
MSLYFVEKDNALSVKKGGIHIDTNGLRRGVNATRTRRDGSLCQRNHGVRSDQRNRAFTPPHVSLSVATGLQPGIWA